MIRFACPACGMAASAPEEWSGQSIKCQGCQAPLKVPGPANPPRDKTTLARVITHEPTRLNPAEVGRGILHQPTQLTPADVPPQPPPASRAPTRVAAGNPHRPPPVVVRVVPAEPPAPRRSGPSAGV